MATRGLNMAFLAAIIAAVFIQISAAQTTYTVGDTTGWTIAPGGASFYSNWAANHSFEVGDILVFNFAANAHDVARVTKADYDACSTTNPISLATISPARITINSTGNHYFICNFTGHCAAGQKLMINVSAATAPAPQPTTPSPGSAPSPSPVATPPPSSVSAPSPSPVSTTPPPSSVSAPSPSPVSTTPPPSSSPSAPSPSSVSTPPGSPATPPSPTTPVTPPPSGSTTPPSPDSSARSLGITGISATVLSIVVALLY